MAFTRYRITISAKPIPKGRPRFTRAGHAYTPSRTENYETRLREEFRFANATEYDGETKRGRAGLPYLGRARVSLSLGFAGADKAADLDNLAKSVLDAMMAPKGSPKEAGVLYDDCQVDELHLSRLSGPPRTEIEIEVLSCGEVGVGTD